MINMDIFDEIKKELQAQTKIENAPLDSEEGNYHERLSFINEYVLV